MKIRLKLYWPTSEQEQFLKQFFPIRLEVIDNTVIRKGRPATLGLRIFGSVKDSQGYIESPRYPDPYPVGVMVNYTLINEAGGPVRLVFEDFQLHFMSLLRIIDSDGAELLNTQGQFGASAGRPAAVQSKGSKLTVYFKGNHYTQDVGFRAKYVFAEDGYWPEKPKSKGCDKLYEKHGGSITIPGNNLDVDAYIDCVWIMGKSSNNEEHPTGFYVRLRGFLNSYGGLTISFTQFYRWATAMCHDSNEFHCDNGRCIKNRLRCDTRDHCGDFSDEKGTQCSKGTPSMGHSKPGGHGGEYTGGKNGHFLGNYTMTIMLVAGLIGLTLMMLMVTVIVARIYRQKLIRRFTQEASAAVRSTSRRGQGSPRDDFTDVGARHGPSVQRVGDRRFYVLPETDVQMFEAPPTYDDALKHPSVPPSRRVSTGSEAEILPSCSVSSLPSPSSRPVSDSAFDNPGFSGGSVEAPAPIRHSFPPANSGQPAVPLVHETSSRTSHISSPASRGQYFQNSTYSVDDSEDNSSDSGTEIDGGLGPGGLGEGGLGGDATSSAGVSHCSDTEDCSASSLDGSTVAPCRSEQAPKNCAASPPQSIGRSAGGPLSGILQWAKGKVTGKNQTQNGGEIPQIDANNSEEITEDRVSQKSGDEEIVGETVGEDVEGVKICANSTTDRRTSTGEVRMVEELGNVSSATENNRECEDNSVQNQSERTSAGGEFESAF